MSKIEVLRQHLMRLYREHLAAGMLPTSGRFLFYELVQAAITEKHASGILKPSAKRQRRADQDITQALTQLRESGLIPWSAIVDEMMVPRFDGHGGYAASLSACSGVL